MHTNTQVLVLMAFPYCTIVQFADIVKKEKFLLHSMKVSWKIKLNDLRAFLGLLHRVFISACKFSCIHEQLLQQSKSCKRILRSVMIVTNFAVKLLAI